jgi:hypothetical protein
LTLALALGKTLDEIGGMSTEELEAWRTYYHDAPFEPWLRSAMICSTIANFAGRNLKDGSTVTPADFLPGGASEPDPTEHFQSLHG